MFFDWLLVEFPNARNSRRYRTAKADAHQGPLEHHDPTTPDNERMK
jgi:hypothetical protein